MRELGDGTRLGGGDRDPYSRVFTLARRTALDGCGDRRGGSEACRGRSGDCRGLLTAPGEPNLRWVERRCGNDIRYRFAPTREGECV